MVMNPTLFEAYRRTSFQSNIDGKSIVIHPGECCPELDDVLKARAMTAWAFITAYNPRSERLSDEENHLAQLQLKAAIEEGKWLFFPGVGQPEDDKWEAEASFLVLGILRDQALHLGRRFGQLAIVFGARGERAELLECLREGD